MDTWGRMELVGRPPTEEIVTEDEMHELLGSEAHPRHYIGLEISGFLHLGSLVSTGYKVNDLAKAGVDCTIFLADWHTMINDKLGGDMDRIARVADYYRRAFGAVCPTAEIITGTDLYDEHPEYWTELVRFTMHMPLARTMRALTIMGRSEDAEKLDLGKLIYPAMQAVDIHFLDVDIAHAGMDQRRIHMLVREIYPKMGWKVPVALHQRLLPGLSRPADSSAPAKMSKSDPGSGIFMHDTSDEVRSKIRKAWCEEKNTKNNPLLEIARQIIFHENKTMEVERPEKFGGNASYAGYAELEAAFGSGDLHPSDLKSSVARYVVPLVEGLADKASPGEEIRGIMGSRG
ncbi:tyrosyl-tRNA synthetase [Cenarchaeum symbiosum A]|uniref:tyrosine--tRNA ligase n=1 Tax=Cenarchaeum symbiosum (strain A) TaxID=414004 RepID=A0RXI3_CENSY|nr:tyrosyl-tRNA synthetase [Cenarchaeum symbiosum A]